MAAQVEVQTGDVGRTVAGGRLHLSPLTDSSNKSLSEISSISQSRVLASEPNKPVPGPKPRLTPKPFAVEKNPTIKPILAPKPQTKPRPQSTHLAGYKPELPISPKPQETATSGKIQPVSASFKTSNKLNTGQTTKPIVQPFKPAPSLDPGDPSKWQKPGATSLTYSRSLKTLQAAEWSGTTKKEIEKDQKVQGKSGNTITRAKSMGFLVLVGQEEEEKAQPEVPVPRRPQPRASRPRPVSAIFPDSVSKTETPVPTPRWTARRPLSADLTSKFESIGLSLHRKDPKTNTSEEETLPQKRAQDNPPRRTTLQSPDGIADTVLSEMAVKDTEEDKRGVSIKSRISLLLDSSSSPGAGPTDQGSDLHSPVQPVLETETAVGVKQLIKQLTVDTTPTQSPVAKPVPKPRPLLLDLTKRFSSEKSPDLVPLTEGADRLEISKDPQSRAEEPTLTPSDQKTFLDLKDSQEQLKKAPTSEGLEARQKSAATSKERGPAGEVQTVRASLFENVVERHSVLMMDDISMDKDLLSSPSFKKGDTEDEGTLVTATYREPLSPSSPVRVLHAFDTLQAVEENRVVSESVPSAQRENKAMTLRSRRSEGSRPVADKTDTAQGQTALSMMPDRQPRILRVGGLQKWATGLDQATNMETGMLKDSQREEQVSLDKDRDRQRAAEQDDVAAKRLKMLQPEEQSRPKATYFALTGQIHDLVSPGDVRRSIVDTTVPCDDSVLGSVLGGSQGKVFPIKRNPSLDEAFGKTSQEQVVELMTRSHMSPREIRTTSDIRMKEEIIDAEKTRETERNKAKMKELEREKQKQLEIEKKAHLEFARMKERENQREFERQRQRAFEKEKQESEEKQRALERQKQIELEKRRELERQKQLQQLLEREKQELQRQRELEKQRELEQERQRLLEREKQRELERLKEIERLKLQERERRLEMERQRELDKQRQLFEKQKMEELERIKELERQQLLEFQKQKEKEMQQSLELEKHRQREKAEREEAQKKRQMALEQEMLIIRELEKERERQKEMEERQKEIEKERQKELDKQRQLFEKQKMEELKRQKYLEFQKQKQKEKEMQQILELEKHKQREKAEREEAEKIRQMALEQEMLRMRELEKERERLKEMEKERQKEIEKERQKELEKRRQRDLDRQRLLDIERQELEKQRLRQQEQEKEKQRMEERLKEMERRQLLEFEKLKQAERDRLQNLDLEKHRQEKMEREEAEKLRHIAKQQEAERQKEKQKKEEQERLRLESSHLRPKAVDVDSILRNDQLSKPHPQRSDFATRWKEPYKPSVLDIDSFTSLLSPNKDLFPVSSVQGGDAEFGAKLVLTPEKDVSWKVPTQTSIVWTPSPQDPWELQPVEMSVDKPLPEPRKPTNKPSPEQLLLRQEERILNPQRPRPSVLDDPFQLGPFSGTETNTSNSPGGLPSSTPAELTWLPRELQPRESGSDAQSHRRSQGSQELNRTRSRSVSRRSAPSGSALEGNLSRIRSRSAHREQNRHSLVQQKQSGEDEETRARETDSQYGTWETGLHTDDSLTPATPSSESNLSPSPRKASPSHTSGDHASQPETDTVDGLTPLTSSEPLPFPDAPTTLLDTSALRSKAQLGKKRAPRTRPTRAPRQNVAQTERDGGTTEDWLYKDSTEAKAESKDDDSDSEQQTRGADAGTAVASQPQRIALFPGMDPSALKAQLKKRGDSDNQTDGSTPSPSQLSRSPKSTFPPRGALVLPPPGGKENGEENSPQWLKELKSKKRLSQYENET